ncbi:glycosyltransferase family 2 protein [Pseudodesulfovibrio tunisiensis]|uniref:glycosyltransferase family 2 protein n=1 Tax=Pseudodesulfovibrio tunisiensis TaxID=463192 RepID=UPI001FB30938|nr:glycosyltransferase family 2 protein [Pseudodesulfovibrio tunisiensis]
MANNADILVVIPAHNEEQMVGETVRDVMRVTGLPVLVIDDASTDATADRAREAGARVMPLAAQLGAWGATQAGMRYAKRHGFRRVVTFDADGQHDPQGIHLLVDCLDRNGTQVAVGACTGRGSRLRRVAWALFRLLSGLSVADLTSGFRGYEANAITVLAGRNATVLDYQDVGVLCLLRASGFRIAEVDVCMFPRTNGKSRIFNSWLSVFQYMLYSMVLSVCHFRPSGGK